MPELPDPQGDGLAFRFSILGGWQLPERHDLAVTMDGDGRVVIVRDSSVFSSTDDYRSLLLDEVGVGLLTSVVARGEEGMSRGSPGVAVGPTELVARLSRGRGPGAVADAEAAVGPPAAVAPDSSTSPLTPDQLAGAMVDLSWLAPHMLEPEGPWVPHLLSIVASPGTSTRSGVPPDAPVAPWPLPVGIEDLVQGEVDTPYGMKGYFCLSGEDVAPVFALLTGVNHAYLRVDDGRVWELNVSPRVPGYQLSSDPC